ncbi:MAG TPA: hypothetical protein VJ779_19275 [Acetobacteraceae bacterium]|nr:hypothetical protein [Acetobacteraceae bacterium]
MKGAALSKKMCAYCGQPGRSREHIFPTWLIEKTPDFTAKLSVAAGKVSQNEHVVYDVCEPCNNGPLSLLDTYAKGLYERYFSTIVTSGEVEFSYDFARLTRWLLKVSFNAARKARADATSFEAAIPYILGLDRQCPDRLLFLAEVVTPSTIVRDGKESVIDPDDHRAGAMHFRGGPAFVFIKEGRFVALNSFYFYIVFLHEPLTGAIFNELRPKFPFARRLLPDAQSIRLRPGRSYLEVKLAELGAHRDVYRAWHERGGVRRPK